MKIRNLTPHEIYLHTSNGEVVTYPVDGIVPRCAVDRQLFGDFNGVRLNRTVFGAVEGLPAPEPGVYLIVSSLIAQACPTRKDLLVPDEIVRDSAGRIIGCRAFGVNAS
jgi:hypothetical protein